jgi:hypothetical protein
MQDKNKDLNIRFDIFARENLWALSSLRAFLYDEYGINPDLKKLPKIIVSLILQFDRHMTAAEASGKINIVKHTRTAFASIEEPLFQSQELLKELKFRGYPVPNGLIESRKKGDWSKAEKYLKEFHKNMKAFIANEGKMPEFVKKHSKSLNNLNSWSQVLFCALPRGLETRVKGKILSEQELISKRLTTGNIKFIHKISSNRGFIDKTVFSEYANLSQAVKRLNDSLREAFQLNEDPIIYNKKAKGFKARFKAESDPAE